MAQDIFNPNDLEIDPESELTMMLDDLKNQGIVPRMLPVWPRIGGGGADRFAWPTTARDPWRGIPLPPAPMEEKPVPVGETPVPGASQTPTNPIPAPAAQAPNLDSLDELLAVPKRKNKPIRGSDRASFNPFAEDEDDEEDKYA